MMRISQILNTSIQNIALVHTKHKFVKELSKPQGCQIIGMRNAAGPLVVP